MLGCRSHQPTSDAAGDKAVELIRIHRLPHYARDNSRAYVDRSFAQRNLDGLLAVAPLHLDAHRRARRL